MIQQQTFERARRAQQRTVDKPQFRGLVTDLILPDAGAPAPRPQSFLVEQISDWTLPTHYHQEHQFQVFVRGSGRLGRSPVGLLTVHYASPHTAYGPLISGEHGLAYMTLRAVGDTGAWYLPEQREQLLLRIPKQHAHGAPATQISPDMLRGLTAPAQETVLEPDDTGLAAWVLRVPPNRSAEPPAADHAHAGRFYVVTQGSLRRPDDELTALATVWAAPDDSLALQAGADGLEVVVLQFPLAAARSFIEDLGRPPSPPIHQPSS